MSIGLTIDGIFTEIGTPEILHSFFSTISFHLEPEGWGTRFPELMNGLYRGRLEPGDADKALGDARLIDQQLRALPPERVVWDIEDVARLPPWGAERPAGATSLADAHTTSTGRILMDALVELLEYQVSCRQPITVLTLARFRAETWA